MRAEYLPQCDIISCSMSYVWRLEVCKQHKIISYIKGIYYFILFIALHFNTIAQVFYYSLQFIVIQFVKRQKMTNVFI